MINILPWIVQPKNAILTVVTVAFIGLFTHDRYLSNKVDKKVEEISILQAQIINLKTSIQLQNDSIKKMNTDFILQKSDFEKKYTELQVKNKSKIESIKKSEAYVSPPNVITINDELEQSRKLILEFEKERGIK